MPRPIYTTLEQVKAKLPYDFIVQALDDDKDGEIDEEVWSAVAADAADQVDARLGARYTTPFNPDALEPVVKSASLMFVLETLYQRRGFGTDETNPYLSSARAARAELKQIGNGEMPLTPEARKPRPSISIVTEPARTSSGHGHLAS